MSIIGQNIKEMAYVSDFEKINNQYTHGRRASQCNLI